MMRKLIACCCSLFALLAGAGLVMAQGRAQTQPVADPAALAAELKIAGKPLAAAEGRALAEKLDARVFLPGKNWFTLQCEFAPRFIQIDTDRNPDLARKAAHNLNLILFEGELFFLFQEEALLGARKAVLTWERTAPGVTGRSAGVVRLFDAQGKPIIVHPFVGAALGSACIRMLQLDLTNPLRLPAGERWETHWFLDAANPADQALRCLAREKGKSGPWQLIEIRFDRDRFPLTSGIKLLNDKGQWEFARKPRHYARLGQSEWAGMTQTGEGPQAVSFTWQPAGERWAVASAKGTHENLATPQADDVLPYEYAFGNVKVNQGIDETLLAWPESEPVRMNFSTPDSTVATIFDCLLKDRPDLLPYCTVNVPREPMPGRAPATYMGYLLATNASIRERLTVLEKLQHEGEWLYRVKVPKLWMKTDLESTYKLKNVGGQWKLDGDFSDLNRALFD